MFYIQHLSLTAILIRKTFPRFIDEEAEPEMGVEAGTLYPNLNLCALLFLIMGAQERRRKMPSSIGGDVLDFGAPNLGAESPPQASGCSWCRGP